MYINSISSNSLNSPIKMREMREMQLKKTEFEAHVTEANAQGVQGGLGFQLFRINTMQEAQLNTIANARTTEANARASNAGIQGGFQVFNKDA